MKTFVVVLAICSIASSKPSYHQHGSIQLAGVPDISAFQKITYPKYDLLPLGEYHKGSVPSTIVTINSKEVVKVPQPYPVKVPYPVPHPVPISKPYPVVETKYVQVPHPVPVEIVKKVPYPVEVPKPYPVQVGDHHQQQQSGTDQGSYGGSFSGYGGGEGHLSQLQGEEQSGGYDQAGQYASAIPQEQGWAPSQGVGTGYGVSEQTQESPESQH